MLTIMTGFSIVHFHLLRLLPKATYFIILGLADKRSSDSLNTPSGLRSYRGGLYEQLSYI